VRSLFVFRGDLTPRSYTTFAVGSFAVIFLVWSLLSYGKLVDPFFLPTPTVIGRTFWRLCTQDNFLWDVWVSTTRVLVAFTLSAAIAIPLGVLMSAFKPLEALMEPVIDFVRYLPVPALVPLTILWVGIGESEKILLLFIGTFFQLVLLVMDDANNVPKQFFETAYTLGAPTRDVVTRVLVPAIMPNVWDDLRITLGWCWTYLLIGEIVAAKSGIGHMIQEGQRFAKPDVVIVGVLTIGVIGIASDFCFKLMGQSLFPYQIRRRMK
jgi:NitT/TauT family transport system permease protein